MIRAVVFDMDGVLLESEQVWDDARRRLVSDHGGHWVDRATTDMQGMSSPEWAAYLHDELHVGLPPGRIVDLVVEAVLERYRRSLPLIPGARSVVESMAGRWPLALASSANRPVIDAALEAMGMTAAFTATVSSEEVPRGKPYPDVYLEAARRLGRSPAECLAVEDSANGIRSAVAAGLVVVAVPNREFPPPDDVLGQADVVLERLPQLTVELVLALEGDAGRRRDDLLDEEEDESFPASDAHSDWAGPPD